MQKDFPNIRRLTLAATKNDGAYYYFARRLHINENTLTLLYALGDGQAHSQKQVCDDWLLPKTTVSTNVRELREAGYLELEPIENTREKALILTESGKAFAETVLQPLYHAEQAAMEKTLARFSPEFIDAFQYFAACFQTEIFSQAVTDEEQKKKGKKKL